eukprot:NODE_20169_length_809_cov_78.739003.p2 GENE.NODE_20169_length_809_cov_78.739003~~NODE_20169_length_809_cov_78.739003.p2  ORF type:complete len:155 (-),score=37.32 NODE_20169_length_809_cov_78.739003:343-774(-)
MRGKLNIEGIAAVLKARLDAAAATARGVAQALQELGGAEVEVEHLVRLLLQPQPNGRRQLPPLLAQGAAHIIAAEFATNRRAAMRLGGHDAEVVQRTQGLGPIPLRPAAERAILGDEERVDRWGFKDTRFAAEWADGRTGIWA